MNEFKTNNLAIKLSKMLAVALLKQNGTISYTEIESLPFVNHKNDVENIATFLLNNFNTKKETVKVNSSPILSWETKISL